jgi:alanyl-tRNA synthetase
VRVIDIGYSKELCGGIHTEQTGSIGLFCIVKEGSVAAGVRRIEAVSGEEAIAHMRGPEMLLEEVAELLKTPSNKLLDRVSKLLVENTEYAKEIKMAKKSQLGQVVASFTQRVEKIKEMTVVLAECALDAAELRDLAEGILEQLKSGVVVLIAKAEDKCQALVRVSPDWVSRGVKASEVIKAISPIIEGGGGGKADSAQAGGKAPHKAAEALAVARQYLAAC